ncbi:MAG TPA: PH domain-containing protein [Usitatibacter sp.]|nr:PH domain-containing protein [Usitatibacter sp.]
MSYIDESLIEGETLIHRARVSWWSQFWLVFLGILTLVVVLGLVFLAWAWVRVRSTELAITNRRVIAKFGFVKRHTVEINLDKVEALRVEQGVWGRILNFGTIFISGAGTSVAPIPNIADPLVFRRKFMEATNRPLSMPRST